MASPLDRRSFLAASSGVMLAAQLPQARGAESDRLALDGGEKAVRTGMPKLVRWGEPEREQLTGMLEQDSLFYWKGTQTTTLIERFKGFCPLEHVMTCSSGTAALHIAVAAAGIARVMKSSQPPSLISER